ncbi:MAG: sigma 54-interacting transcriptional regulator [Candidatus Anammoxibacter sp.]
MPLKNCLCNLVNSNGNGLSKRCHQNYRKYLDCAVKSREVTKYRCFAGLNGVIVPLYIDDNCFGSIVGSGLNYFRSSDRLLRKYKTKLIEFGIEKTRLDECYMNLRTLSDHNEQFFIDFIQYVAGDIVSVYKELQEKDELIKRESVLLEESYNGKYKGIIGSSRSMKKLFHILDEIGNSESPVLIEGASGTGKELLASSIHYNSRRSDKIFVAQNCSTFSKELLNSELFGHEKGAFTGALNEKKGMFELANRGPLFLDEIGDMDIDVQAKLLRVLESGTFYRVGGTEEIKVDVRIVTATNKDLKEQIKKGLFREDLYYRINTMLITMPPLKERKEDVLLLIKHFFAFYCKVYNVENKDISPDVLDVLIVYDWPGNVRELKNTIERLIIVSGKEKTIEINHIPESIKSELNPDETFLKRPANGLKLKEALMDFEKGMINEALDKTKWNKTKASNALGISRSWLNKKIEQLKIVND